ncbi:hypothetical protein Fot_14255 [Forsythia ovata]|uniref:Uncharacterized protein n=1 Tax=Forsythia ovata TaxID=205694 RepID=A0ABD1W5T3_9LAMI
MEWDSIYRQFSYVYVANILVHQKDTCLHPEIGGVSGREYLSVVTVGYQAREKSSGITTYFQTGQLSSSRKIGRRFVSIKVLRRAPNFVVPQSLGSLRQTPSWALYVGRLAGLSTLDARLGSLNT